MRECTHPFTHSSSPGSGKLCAMSRESWLDIESQRWQRDGLISDETRRAILARYPKQESDPARILIPLAVLTAGVAIVLLVAWNWHALPAAVKLGLTSLLTIALYFGAAWSAGRRSRASTELWLLAAALGGFTLFAALADVYLWNDVQAVTLLCAITAAVTAAATGATLVTALAAATLGWWVIVAGGGTIPWPFLLVFPFVAFAAEQSRNRVVATLTAVSFAAWVTIMAANTWVGGAQTMVFVMLAGAAIEQWSHQPPARRLVFARATPGSAIAIAGLVVMLVSVVHANPTAPASALFATQAGQSPWPALALGACLIVIAFGVSRQAAPRPRALAVAAALWLNAVAAGRVAMFGDWPWVALFSAALLFVGASLVRESAQSHDRGTLALGLSAVLALVIVHFSSGAALQGASVLLVSAAVLFLAGRHSRHRAGATQGPAQ